MESRTISKHVDSRDDQDYGFLRQVGLQHIKSMAGKLWSDYNAHDPGITFLELLCYAITDLGYRIQMPVPDLIAKPEPSSTELKDVFPTAKQILTTKPISESDYRKLFIDIDGVKNAFIRPYNGWKVFTQCSHMDEVTNENPKGKLSYEKIQLPDYTNKGNFALKGLNKILFELDSQYQQMEETDPERVAKVAEIDLAIKNKYHANRNLCEDLVEVKEVDVFEFQVCGDIEIDKMADAQQTVVEILFRIQEHVAPSVKRYSLNELLEKGLKSDEIFNGPVLEHGFITDDELEVANFQTEIRLSDIIQIISETPGVASIKDISLMSCPCNEEEEDGEDCVPETKQWKICFPKGFDKIIKLCTENSIINVFKDVIPITVNQGAVQDALKEKFEDYNESLELTYDDFEIPEGVFRNSGDYFSIQNELPEIYGVGEVGLSPNVPEARKAQAKQLQAFLAFFDQILATYFSHVEHVGKLLSADMHGTNTYYIEKLTDVKNFENLLKYKDSYEEDTAKILSKQDDFVGRKGTFLDHLLARFAENMNDYVFLMIDLFGMETQEASLWHKAKFLEEYSGLGFYRAKAFDYFDIAQGVWDTYNVSGLEHRIARLLGIRDFSRRDLTSYYYEFYPEADADPTDEWRWRVRHTDSKIMFSSSKHYDSMVEAEDELWKTISLAWDEANYQLLPTYNEEKWYFNLVDHSGEVIARHIQFYTNKSEAEATIKEYAAFMFDKVTDEGMYMFENILLRPDVDDSEAETKFFPICVDENCEQCKPNDPYSFRLTFVFPGWTKRFSNLHFREFAEKVIREEVPAHILTRICWIGSPEEDEEESPSQIKLLEERYRNWLQLKMESPENQKNNVHLGPLAHLIHELDTIYPQGRLHDCNKDGDGETSIIINKTSLGEIKKEQNGSE